METTTVYKCEECEEIFEDDSEFEPLYECNNCGTKFIRSNSYNGDSHQCPDCMKFASKLSDNGCPSCGEGECSTDEMIQTEDGDWVYPEDAETEDAEDGDEEPSLKPISKKLVESQQKELARKIMKADEDAK